MNTPDPLNALRDLEHQLTAVRAQLSSELAPREREVAALQEQLEIARHRLAHADQEASQLRMLVAESTANRSSVVSTLRKAVEVQLKELQHELRRSSLQSLERVEFVLDCLDAAERGEQLPEAPRIVPHQLPSPLSAAVTETPPESQPELLPVMRHEVLPPVTAPEPLPPVVSEPAQPPMVAEPVAAPPLPEAPSKPKKVFFAKRQQSSEPKEEKKGSAWRSWGVGLASLTVSAGAFVFLWNTYQPLADKVGTVAGVQTTASQESGSTQYPNADRGQLPLSETVWHQADEPTFGLEAFEYPKNTSELVQSGGGSTIYFLTKDPNGIVSHFFKISKFEPEGTVADWTTRLRADLKDMYTFSEGKMGDYPATIGTDKDPSSATAGTLYVVPITRVNELTGPVTTIYQIWVKNLAPTDPNSERAARMLASIHFNK